MTTDDGSPTPVSQKARDLRRHGRFRIDDAEVVVFPERFLTAIGLGRSNRAKEAVNLSEGGCLVRCREKLTAGDKVRIRIRMEKFDDLFDCRGQVRWCFESANDPGDFYAGIAFLDLPSGHADKITKMRSWFTSKEYRIQKRSKTGPNPRIIIDR